MNYEAPSPIQSVYQPSRHMWLADDGWHWPVIYAMHLTENGKPLAMKIGFSGAVESRRHALHYYMQCHLVKGRKLEIVAQYECELYRETEFRAHEILIDKSAIGEWFRVGPEEAIAAIEQAISDVRRRKVAA